MAPQGNSGETLTDRSQRILGVALDGQDRSEIGGKSRKSNGSPTRRREQVAQAQRKHRQRTQKYIRELENEVLRLRGCEKTLTAENSRLQKQLELFQGTSTPNDNSVSTASNFLSPTALTTHTLNSKSDSCTSETSSTNIDLTAMSFIEPQYSCHIIAAERSPIEYQGHVKLDMNELSPLKPEYPYYIKSAEDPPSVNEKPISGEISWPSAIEETPFTPSMSGGNSDSLFNAQSAINFILKLEHHCLPHLKHYFLNHISTAKIPDIQYNYMASHAFNASTTLFYEHLAQDPLSHTFSIPNDEVDRLLEASRFLNLEDEYTPVQVWSLIRELATTHSIDFEMLQSVTEELSKYAYCNSFGSVIDKSIVATIFARFSLTPNVLSEYTS